MVISLYKCITPTDPRFIRDDEPPESVSWEERLARAYESKLFKEYALIDLKHYKSRRLALRWRTAPEVVDGLGEDTCGSLRCKWHQLPLPVRNGGGGQVGFDDDDDADDGYGGFVRDRYGVYDHDQDDDDDYRSKRRRKEKRKEMPKLRAFELPFVYEEAGERKEALVKVKLCPKCQAKLTWKPGPDEGSRRAGHGDAESESEEDDGRAKSSKYQSESAHQRVERHSTRHRDRSDLPSDRRGQMVGSDTRDRDRGRERDHRDEPSSGTNRQTGPASRSRSPRRRER